MLDITTEPSHRIIGAHHSVMLRLFWLGLTTPLNTSKTACKRLYAIHAPRDVYGGRTRCAEARIALIIARDYPNILTISVF